MLELIVTAIFAAIVAAGAVQLLRTRPMIRAVRAALRGESRTGRLHSPAGVERRAAVAQWERQRDLLIAAVLLLVAGAALTPSGDPLRRAFPWWGRLVGVAVFFGIGITGIIATILRSSARARRLGLLCPRCGAPLASGADRTRELLRTGRCRKCRDQVLHVESPPTPSGATGASPRSA